MDEAKPAAATAANPVAVPRRGRMTLRVTAAVCVLILGAMVAHAIGAFGDSAVVNRIANDGATVLLQVIAATLLMVRAMTTSRNRLGWSLMAIATSLYSAGMIVWVTQYSQLDEPPFPSLSDALWLSFYPLMIATFARIVYQRMQGRSAAPIMDGVVAGLAAGTLCTAVIMEAVLQTANERSLAVLVNLAYPVFDLLLFALVMAYLSLSGWRLNLRWALVTSGVVVFAIADSVYTYSVANAQLTLGSFVNVGYSAGLLMIAFAGWFSADEPAKPTPRGERLRAILPSIVLSAGSVAVLVTDHYIDLNSGAIWMATISLAVALTRTALAFRENVVLLDASRQALQDELTGLPNRRMFLRQLAATTTRADADGHRAAVLLIDLDRFKEVNDSLGHHVGDELLRIVARRLTDTLRGNETVARLGGDEFCVILNSVDGPTDAGAVATRVLIALEEPVLLEGMRIDVGASIGVSVFPDHGTVPSELLRSADVAMYQAKNTGGNEHAVYDPAVDTNVAGQLSLMGDFRGALDRDEIEVHYQPRYDSGTGAMRGLEALVRWNHPVHGMLQPHSFLPGIERSALIFPLTEFVLRTALVNAARWLRKDPDLSVAVNLSARLLHTNGLVDTVREALADAGVPASCLELEITETMLMANPERATELLDELSQLGVRIAVDDFGVGHASLAYLTNLPVSILKIDRSFIERMELSDRDAAVVAAIVDLSKRLGMVSVAEGIENEHTLRRLATLGCDEVQGYLMAVPAPCEGIDRLIGTAGWGDRHLAALVP